MRRAVARPAVLLLAALAFFPALAGCPRRGGTAPPSAASPRAPRTHTAAASTESVRFFALGDGGTGGPDQYRVAAAIQRKCEAAGCDFGVLLGDNVYPDGVTAADDPQWKSKFEEPYAGLLARGLSFYAVLGNHDYADGQDLGRGVFQVAYGAVNGQWRMPAEHYVFAEGPALFIGLDTQKIVANDHLSVAEQGAMIERALDGNTRPWIVGLGHHPYVSNGTNGNAGRLLSAFLEEPLCRVADLYLSGHDHDQQVLAPAGPCKSLFVVAGGGGYETYALVGSNPALFQAQSLGFAYLRVEPQRLALEMLDAEGAVLFSTELRK